MVFNNDIFRIYTQKYVKYKELVKRIALLLKKPKFYPQTSKNTVPKINNNNSNICEKKIFQIIEIIIL